MKRLIVLFILTFSFLYAATPKSLSDAVQLAKKQEKNVLLFVYSDYCYYCKSMLQNTLLDKEVKEFIDKRFVFLKINQNKKELLREDIKTDFVPITYIISEDGEILLELPGRKDKQTFISIVKDTLLE